LLSISLWAARVERVETGDDDPAMPGGTSVPAAVRGDISITQVVLGRRHLQLSGTDVRRREPGC
jgi:hypothetical protein